MDHSEVVRILAQQCDVSLRRAEDILGTVAAIIKLGLAEHGRCQIDGLGSFGVKDVPAGRVYPGGGIRVIPAHGLPTFTPSRSLKTAVKDVRKSAS